MCEKSCPRGVELSKKCPMGVQLVGKLSEGGENWRKTVWGGNKKKTCTRGAKNYFVSEVGKENTRICPGG